MRRLLRLVVVFALFASLGACEFNLDDIFGTFSDMTKAEDADTKKAAEAQEAVEKLRESNKRRDAYLKSDDPLDLTVALEANPDDPELNAYNYLNAITANRTDIAARDAFNDAAAKAARAKYKPDTVDAAKLQRFKDLQLINAAARQVLKATTGTITADTAQTPKQKEALKVYCGVLNHSAKDNRISAHDVAYFKSTYGDPCPAANP
jgi:hypothetical protein